MTSKNRILRGNTMQTRRDEIRLYIIMLFYDIFHSHANNCIVQWFRNKRRQRSETARLGPVVRKPINANPRLIKVENVSEI